MAQPREHIPLPEPGVAGDTSLEQLLRQRRSVRAYRDTALRLADISQLLWSAQGITHAQGYRTAPSAGALYPLELYVVAGNVEGLAPGVYHYQPDANRLTRTRAGDQRRPLANSALAQTWIAEAPAVMVFTAVYARTTRKYGERGVRYVHMETGHAAQNLFLQAEALGLDTVVVGAFRDDQLADVLALPEDVEPLMLMPVGRK
ncbi:MAG: SagB/ThcOx family dehydrogenase [Gammaproteobacteria bacterium]|jgi:SagB-type dehydrogenase family enzyme